MSVNTATCGINGCRNPRDAQTGGPCYLHVSGAVHNSPRTAPTTTVPSASSAAPTPAAIQAWARAAEVFEDIDDVITVDAVREQVLATVRAAVSIEAMRSFKHIDTASSEDRTQLALALRQNIAERLRPKRTWIDAEDAADKMRVSSDEYGRPVEDSADIIAFGLMQERAMGLGGSADAVSPDGTPFANAPEDYLTVVGERVIDQEVRAQFGRELNRYHDIVRSTAGRPARNPGPFPASLLQDDETGPLVSAWYQEQSARRVATERADSAQRAQYEQEQRQLQARAQHDAEERQRKRDANRKLAGTLFGIAGEAAAMSSARKAAKADAAMRADMHTIAEAERRREQQRRRRF